MTEGEGKIREFYFWKSVGTLVKITQGFDRNDYYKFIINCILSTTSIKYRSYMVLLVTTM